MMTCPKETIQFDEGWSLIQKGIRNFLEGLPHAKFRGEEHALMYYTIYCMCTQNQPNDYSQQLYQKHKESVDEYLYYMVFPSLREKHGEIMLREFVKTWANHKAVVKWLSSVFSYVDRYYVLRQSLPSLKEVGLTCFRDLVYREFSSKARDAVIALINREREGEQIDRDLLKNVLDIFVEMGTSQMDYYVHDFEDSLLADTAMHYSRKAANWITQDLCPHGYTLKAEECLQKEKERASNYLHSSSEGKLLEIVRNELLVAYSRLLEKEQSGGLALLRDHFQNFTI